MKILVEVDLGVSCGPMYQSMIRIAQDNADLALRAGVNGFEQVRVIGSYGDIQNEVRKDFMSGGTGDDDHAYMGAPTEVIGILKRMADKK